MSDDALEERIAEARRRSRDATRASYEAQEALTHLEIEAATARARAKLEGALAQGALSPELHGELVCDAARDHGATCARARSISEVSWRAVRVAVASIVDRLASVERERDETHDRAAIAEDERDALAAQLAALHAARERAGRIHDDRIHEMDRAFADVVPAAEAYTRRAEERGARWALEAEERATDGWIDSDAARICAEARAKGGE